jgi:hypothetical protein
MNPADAQPRTGSEHQPRAARIVQGWAHIYTAGLPPAVREDRAAELRSDLWEQLHDPEQDKARQVIGRLAKGIPADLVWRLETRYHLGGLMTGTALLATRIGSALAALVAAFWLFWAVAWTQPGFGILAALFAVMAAVLWWAGTTPEARDRHRRLVIGSAITTSVVMVIAAFLAVGTG